MKNSKEKAKIKYNNLHHPLIVRFGLLTESGFKDKAVSEKFILLAKLNKCFLSVKTAYYGLHCHKEIRHNR